MKLSICIPVYNRDIAKLVQALELEIQEQSLDAEIVIIDDASSNKDILDKNNSILESFPYIKLSQNVGRSQIRNLFIKFAKGEYLLFLDCDGLIINEYFISNYLHYLDSHPESMVIYGGRVVSSVSAGKDYDLRWLFAKNRENPSLKYRKQHPYLCFQTNNFLIKKDIFSKISFENQLKKYGYEDVLFSFELKSAGIKIDHLDNPVFNNDIESNLIYLQHVEESIGNIAWLLHQSKYREELKEIKLIKAYLYLEKLKLKKLYRRLMLPFKNKLRRDLEGKAISLRKLDLYKLLLLVEKT